MNKCNADCEACLICEKDKTCCNCKNQYHGCVTWPRDKKKTASENLADKIEDAANRSDGGNPFKGLKFTDEERELLAEAGIV